MVDIDMYPHRCEVYRGGVKDILTGKVSRTLIFSGKCYFQENEVGMTADILQGNNVVMLEDSKFEFLAGDMIDVHLENGMVMKGEIRNAYPIEDDDIGGQNLQIRTNNVED